MLIEIQARKDGETEETNGTTENGPTNVPGQAAPLTSTTNEALTAAPGEEGLDDKAGKSKVKQPRKQRGPPEDGIPSKNKIMVANLPYDLREEKVRTHSLVQLHNTSNEILQLLEIFADYSPTSAKIALRPIPKFMVRKLQARNEPRKGRGFGFVTLSSEELQQKACADMNGKEIEGREIAVKVAIDSPGKEDEDPNALLEGEPQNDTSLSTAEGSANVNTVTA